MQSYTFVQVICRAFVKEASTTNLTRQGIEHGPPRHEANALLLGYRTGIFIKQLIIQRQMIFHSR